MSKKTAFKNMLKVLGCFVIFSTLFSATVFASGSWSSTYSITSPCCRVGSLESRTFAISNNNRTVTVALSNSTHNAGRLNVSLERRNGLLGWGSVNTLLFSANQSRSFTSGNSGDYRLFMWNEFNGAHATGLPSGTATNSGNIRVVH